MDDGDDEADDPHERVAKALSGLTGDLTALRDKLAEMNSMFPATREFLRSKGASNVMELSPEDRRVLLACLQAERDALLGDKKPSN